MKFSEELNVAWDFIEHTNRHVFLTGKAGTGKTTFLRYLVQNSTKRCAVVAPTGVAAVNAGGSTIHSFFQIAYGPYTPNTKAQSKYDIRKEKLRIIRSLDLLVIDEISMVRSDLLDAIDDTLRRVRRNSIPFGGVQLLMIGDLGQLTPVVTADEEYILGSYYDTPYFFGSRALRSTEYVTIELTTVFRQQDDNFLNILNHIRDGMPTDEDLKILNSRYIPCFEPKDNEGYILLTTHNALANSYNDRKLEQISAIKHSFDANIEGTFPEQMYPTEQRLVLKVGAQVMFIKNDTSGDHLYYNGKIGRVTDIDNDVIYVMCQGDSGEIKVKVEEWENTKYEINAKTKELESKVQGKFKQYPLRLAWAITIHKSQGLTFDHAIIDANKSFAPGQVYVALSRCRTLDGMVINSRLTRNSIIVDQRVNNYLAQQGEDAKRSIEMLPSLKENYEKYLLLELFDFLELDGAEERMLRLMIQHFSHSHPQLTQLHRVLSEQFGKNVKDVSLKWRLFIQNSDMDTLHNKNFEDRVVKSCSYFIENIADTIVRLITATKEVTTGNKEVKKRLSELFGDLVSVCTSKLYVLKTIEEKGFSVAGYLKAKQQSWAVDIDQRQRRRKTK